MSRIIDLIDGRAAAVLLLIGVLALGSAIYSLQDQFNLLYHGEQASAKAIKKSQKTLESWLFKREAYLITYEFTDRAGDAHTAEDRDVPLALWQGVEEGQSFNVVCDAKNPAVNAPVDVLRKSMPNQWLLLSVSFCIFLMGVTFSWVKFLDWKRRVDMGVA